MDCDIFGQEVCELTEQKEIDDDPIACVEPAFGTVISGDLKGSHICVMHSSRLKEDGYEIVDELIELCE